MVTEGSDFVAEKWENSRQLRDSIFFEVSRWRKRLLVVSKRSEESNHWPMLMRSIFQAPLIARRSKARVPQLPQSTWMGVAPTLFKWRRIPQTWEWQFVFHRVSVFSKVLILFQCSLSSFFSSLNLQSLFMPLPCPASTSHPLLTDREVYQEVEFHLSYKLKIKFFF